MNTDLAKAVKNDFKDFKNYIFKLMNNSFLEKNMKSVRKHTKIKFVLTEAKRNYLVSEPNYHTTNIKKYISNSHEKNSNSYE